MPVLDLRGTHGSGKSWLMHQLLKLYKASSIMENGKQIGYALSKHKAAVVGMYTRVCGGCDGIKTADEVVRRVKLLAQDYDYVLLEGILVAHTFQRYSNLATEMADYGYTFAFLDTPLEECIARVTRRRLEQGNNKPLDPSNVIKDWHRIWERLRPQCVQAGHSVTILPWERSLPALVELLLRKGSNG